MSMLSSQPALTQSARSGLGMQEAVVAYSSSSSS